MVRRCFSAVSPEPLVRRGGETWLGLFPLTPSPLPNGARGLIRCCWRSLWSGVALVLLVRSLWCVSWRGIWMGLFPLPQPSPQRGEGGDPVLLAVWWSGVALVLSVRSLWYVVAEELGWASFPSPQPSPQRGEGVDSVLLMVFWSGVAFVSQALRVRYAAHGNARAASMSRPASPRRTGPLSLRERARVRGKWSAKTTALKPPRSPPPVGRRAPESRVAHGCPSPPRRPER